MKKTRYCVVDKTGKEHDMETRSLAYEYAKLWTSDCPDDAPYKVKDRKK